MGIFNKKNKKINNKLRLTKGSRDGRVEHISELYEKTKSILVYILVWQKEYTKLFYTAVSTSFLVSRNLLLIFLFYCRTMKYELVIIILYCCAYLNFLNLFFTFVCGYVSYSCPIYYCAKNELKIL